MKNHNLQSFNRIINSEGSSVIGASLFNFLWRVCFNPVQTALAKISYYNIKRKGELKMITSKDVEITFSKAPFSENTNISQSSQARDYSYYYDKEYDNLLITFNTSVPTYSDEIHNNIYLIYSEEDDSIIGTQIMYFKKRSLEILKKYLPKFLFEIVEELNTII